MLTVHLEHDSDLECPNDMDCEWKLYSFSRKHNNYADPSSLGLSYDNYDGRPTIEDKELKKKLDNGLAHLCAYFEHGRSWWGRTYGPIPAGVEFQWDGVRYAGLLIWEHDPSEIGGKTPKSRAEDADIFLRRYSAWANGEVWYYRIENDEEEDVASCGGFDDSGYMLSEIAEILIGEEFEVVGEAAYLEGELRKIVREKERTKSS